MILRRFTKHITEQNWFAVGLDVVVVVVGIFIGLQVDDWNKERQSSKDEVYYLNRILGDIDDSISSNDNAKDFLDNKIEHTYWVVKKLRDGQIKDAERHTFNTRFVEIGAWASGDFIDSTINELQSSGKFGIIKSREFQEYWGRFELELASHRRASQNLADMLKSLDILITARVDRSGPPEQLKLLSSFENLKDDKVLIRYLYKYALMYSYRRENIDELNGYLNKLHTEVSKAIALSN